MLTYQTPSNPVFIGVKRGQTLRERIQEWNLLDSLR